jgi:hypothetical protein
VNFGKATIRGGVLHAARLLPRRGKGLPMRLPQKSGKGRLRVPQDADHRALLQHPIEDDTRILTAKFIRVAEIPFLLERWSGDGVGGCSAVFLTDHVTGMTDAAALRQFLTEHAGIDLSGSTTISWGEVHIFVNFGFEAK